MSGLVDNRFVLTCTAKIPAQGRSAIQVAVRPIRPGSMDSKFYWYDVNHPSLHVKHRSIEPITFDSVEEATRWADETYATLPVGCRPSDLTISRWVQPVQESFEPVLSI